VQVVILAGGLGTRLQSVAGARPKSLVPVAGRPFIEHQFELLRRNGLADVLLCVGHGGDLVRAHVGDGRPWGVRVQYSEEDPARLLGTGGALVHALDRLSPEFLVLYGDSYLPTDYRKVVDAFRVRNVDALMTVYRNEGKWDSSNVRIDGPWVVFFSKAARPGEADCIDYGLTAFRKAVIEEYADAPLPLDLGRIQEDLVRAKRMGALPVAERFYEIGKPEGLRELDALLKHSVL
jgi:NDP-sugar pyrophosphorylase family protein